MVLALTENIHGLNSIMFSFKQFRKYDFKKHRGKNCIFGNPY